MRRSRSIAPVLAVLFLACAVAAWLWFGRGHRGDPQQVAQTSPAPATTAPSPANTPITYVPVQSSSTPMPATTPTSVPVPAAAAASAAPTGAPTAKPVATASPTPTPAPLNAGHTPMPTQMPVEASTIAPAHVAPQTIREAPNAPPRIVAMSLSTPVAHSGETVVGTVETSSNVASVEARIAGYSSSMEKVGVGKFRMVYTVPKLPFFLHRTWSIEVIARNSRGEAVRSSIPITIR